jgi:sugar lactone lactonase YvrE
VEAYDEGMEYEIKCVVDSKSDLGEGPVWSRERQRLYWVDIDKGLVHSYDPVREENRSWDLGIKVGAVVPRKESAGGGLLLATEKGFVGFSGETDTLEYIIDPEADNSDTRFNDGKCDPAGRFWAGTMSYSRTRGVANLWCLATDGAVSKRVTGVTVSNGITWSLDEKTMYYIDSNEFAVVAFDYDRHSGSIGNPQPAVVVPQNLGKPDGMCIDSEGMLWIALFRGGAVTRWNPADGSLMELIKMPALHVTACAFGGKDLRTLFVTSARAPADENQLAEYPQTGGLFALEPGVKGAPFFEYGA